MSLLFSKRDLGDTPNNLIPSRSKQAGSVVVTQDSALRHSAVWACLRLRADLVSTTPLCAYRQVGKLQTEIPPTPLLVDPSGDNTGIEDWLYSSQIDLDRAGNTFGLITARDGSGYPAVIELQPMASVTVRGSGGKIVDYRIGTKTYSPVDIWHERQFTLPGFPLGLSPISYAAATIGNYLSAQQFGLDWFSGGAVPTGHLKNTAKVVDPGEADILKTRFKATQQARDVFVSGNDWEFNPMTVSANESQFLETMQYGINDVARFMGVPGDMIDAPTMSSAKITYANITQRNLQVLVINLGPTFIRREKAFSRALPRPRFVKFDTDSLLRMDTQTRQAMFAAQAAGRLRAPSELRAQDNLPPFTEDQLAEFDRLYGSRTVPPAVTPAPNGAPA